MEYGPLDQLAAQARHELAAAHDGPHDNRTRHLRRAAEHIVNARLMHTTKSGDPDVGGRTGDYRRWMQNVLTGVPLDARDRITSSLRYHVSEVLREHVDPDLLRSAGYRPDPSRVRREHPRQHVADLFGPGAPITSPTDAHIGLAGVRAFLRRLDTDTTGADPQAQKNAQEAVQALLDTLPE